MPSPVSIDTAISFPARQPEGKKDLPKFTDRIPKNAVGEHFQSIAAHPKPCIQGVQGAPPLAARCVSAPGGPPEAKQPVNFRLQALFLKPIYPVYPLKFLRIYADDPTPTSNEPPFYEPP